jgi:fructose-1,6-bisphosphatase/inositol monophosphatase family enzyme
VRDRERFRDCALGLADEARDQLRAFASGSFEVKHKSDGSYVTSADFQVEQRLRARIERQFPDHGIVGEEFPARAPAAEFQWILDPVDGTEDFVQRIPTFGSIIALHYRGEPLAGADR